MRFGAVASLMLKTDEQEVDMSRIRMRMFLSIIGLAMALLLSAAWVGMSLRTTAPA